ncbi:MAG: hypothetical protein M0Z66_16585 [Thermaerobacter sp.]|nr:hypothetical protein [Thermaerobacter sp.]
MIGESSQLQLRPTPPTVRNHGNYVVSVSELSRWLSEKAEELGAYILTETAGQQLLAADGAVRGVHSGDKGRGRDGKSSGNFEPGVDIVAQATSQPRRDRRIPPRGGTRAADVGTGRQGGLVRPTAPRRVIHTLGWPLRYAAKWREFGGSWMYPMGKDKVSLGFVVGLGYTDARPLSSCAASLRAASASPGVPR